MNRIALAVTGAAVVGLTACSSHAAVQGTAAVPVSCTKQYQAWTQGPGNGLIAELHAASVAGAAGDAKALTKAKPAVARAVQHPVPACADPRGYWSVLLMHVNAAVAGKSSRPSVQAAMKDVPQIEDEMASELKGFAAN